MTENTTIQPGDAGEDGEPSHVLDQIAGLLQTSIDTGTPVLIGKGRYGMYATPAGGMHLAYRPEGTDQDEHLEIPPALLRMLMARGNGANPLAAMRAMFG